MHLLRGVLVVLIVVAGCTPLRWERDDTDAPTAEADRKDCRAAARSRAQALNEQPFLVPYFVGVQSPNGRSHAIPVVPWQQFGPPVWMPYAPSLAFDQVTLKYDLFDRCMRAKGYRRVPDDTEDAPPA
ncbi:MAG: hypothetical protein IPK66_14270 [Rhodospirillales bacterium]|nr:hypothetical protein [Rhodospirillales bacterium]